MKIPSAAIEGTGYVPNFLSKEDHEYLLDFYDSHEFERYHSHKLSSTKFSNLDIVLKHTRIEEKLKEHFKNFDISKVCIYEARVAHNLHVDIGQDNPNRCGYDFVIPLKIEGDASQEELLNDQAIVCFNQYYPYGPFKFPPGTWNPETKKVEIERGKVHSNISKTHEQVRNEVWNFATGVYPDEVHKKYLSMYPREMLEGFTVESIRPWEIGSVIALQRTQIHSASRFHDKTTKKVGLQILCWQA